jgi:hypothetical protein
MLWRTNAELADVSDSSPIRSGFGPNLNSELFTACFLGNLADLQMVNYIIERESHSAGFVPSLLIHVKRGSKCDSASGGILRIKIHM